LASNNQQIVVFEFVFFIYFLLWGAFGIHWAKKFHNKERVENYFSLSKN